MGVPASQEQVLAGAAVAGLAAETIHAAFAAAEVASLQELIGCPDPTVELPGAQESKVAGI